jgi:hypothetical protein
VSLQTIGIGVDMQRPAVATLDADQLVVVDDPADRPIAPRAPARRGSGASRALNQPASGCSHRTCSRRVATRCTRRPAARPVRRCGSRIRSCGHSSQPRGRRCPRR